MSSTHWSVLSSWSKAGVGTSIVLELKRPPLSSSAPLPSSSSSSSDSRHHHQPMSKSKSKSNANIKIKSSPRIAFDIGATPIFDDAIPARYVFLSHGHMDHAGALFGHARAHSVMSGGTAPTYFVPAALLPQFERCRDAMSLLDASNGHNDPEEGVGGDHGSSSRTESLIKMNLVAVRPGDELPLKGIRYGSKTSFFVRAIEVDHAGHPALGYVLVSCTASGLKEEYRNLDGARMRDLVKSGVRIKEEPIERIEVAYTGDTCARGLTKNRSSSSDDDDTKEEEEWETTPSASEYDVQMKLSSKFDGDVGQMFRAELLLSELTFLDSSEDGLQRAKASERGHLHINDLDGIFSSHDPSWGKGESDPTIPTTTATSSSSVGNNGEVIFYHLSAKYQPARRALDLIAEGIPPRLRDRCHVAIASMLSREEKSSSSEKNSIAHLIRPNGCISLEEYLSWKESTTATT